MFKIISIHSKSQKNLGVRAMVFITIFNDISVISWLSVLLWRKPEYPEKTTELSQVTDKLFT